MNGIERTIIVDHILLVEPHPQLGERSGIENAQVQSRYHRESF